MARIAFLGTPAIAVPFLARLALDHEVAGVVTMPDAPRGRSNRPQPSPVADAAAGYRVDKPARSSDLADVFRSFGNLDVAVVVAYGALIRPEALAVPQAGCVNVHFSLLPRWRGAAPVQRAILAGDSVTGVTIMKLDEGLDTGPYLGVTAVALDQSLTAADVFGRLTLSGLPLMATVLRGYLAGHIVPVAQPELGTPAPKIAAAESRLSIADGAGDFVAKVMAFSPAPGAWAEHGTGRLRILVARAGSGLVAPGELRFETGTLLCGVASGTVELMEVQPAGGTRMSGADWARGRPGALGSLS